MIKILSEDTIQKIAAGEVVERPASIIKELVENSIDAKADDIIVEIKNGGKSYIKVSDNGTGIESNNVELAFTRHATSKISDFDDLYKIYSMGFRGEALASIISVAKLVMKTKHDSESFGTKIEYENNHLIESSKIGTNTGTSIEVYDLFKYIPARQKFLLSDISESNRITSLMYTFAIGNPEISFSYIKDNREVFTTNNKLSKDENFNTLFGRDFVRNSLKIDAKSENFSLHGTISNNKYYKGNRSMQYIYVNGRYIENEAIVEAVESSYHLLIPTGRFPLFELNLDVNPDLIDINIHPNKQKIKFTFNEELIKLIKESITKKLNESEESKEIKSPAEKENLISFHDLNKGDGYQKILDAYKEPKRFDEFPITDRETISFDEEAVSDITDRHINLVDLDELDIDTSIIANDEDLESHYISKENQLSLKFEDLNFKTIIFDNFIIFENIETKKIIFIDIAKANVRIIYDNSLKNDKIISQELLDPIILSLTSKEKEIFNQNIDAIKNSGYVSESFGDNNIIIRAIPYYLSQPNTIDDFKLLLDDLNITNIENRNKFILRSSISRAIHKKLDENKQAAHTFYNELMNTSNPYTDPNGNTIIYEIGYEEFLKILKL